MRLLLIFIILEWSCMLSAQTERGGHHISHLQLEGLKRTKRSHAAQFLQTEVGDSLDTFKLLRDVQQLRNLTAFANAEFQLDTTPVGIAVTYKVTENHTLFPIVNFGAIKGNFWYQAGINDVNWIGRGMQLTTYYLNNNGQHNFHLYYRVPYIRGSRWGISANLFRWASIEPFNFPEGTAVYDFENSSIGGTGFYEFKLNRHTLEAGGLFFVERHQLHDGQSFSNAPPLLEQPKVLFKIMHRLNFVNYHFFYRAGWYNIVRYETVYALQDQSWFRMLFSDTHFYQRYGKRGNMALRLRLGISTNNNSPFAPFILDSQFNIRGSGNRVDHGTAIVTLNAEYRHTLVETNRLAAQIVGFSDLGTWRQPGGTLEDLVDANNFRHFAGGGIRLIYKKAWDAILRVDYGVDLYNVQERGFVLGVGQYF
ncbi:MAG TPA: hypothetical protein PKD70_06420 [Saprospiraceae bacterium]|nr:hypothetical protein [Saprospiraceae bacterium]